MLLTDSPHCQDQVGVGIYAVSVTQRVRRRWLIACQVHHLDKKVLGSAVPLEQLSEVSDFARIKKVFIAISPEPKH